MGGGGGEIELELLFFERRIDGSSNPRSFHTFRPSSGLIEVFFFQLWIDLFRRPS